MVPVVMKMPPTPSPFLADLGLETATPAGWGIRACADLPALLDDHAHLERKAASNALALLQRWPEHVRSIPSARRDWVRVLSSIATDEARHLGQVLTELERVGGVFSAGHATPYAAALRDLVRRGDGRRELLDRVLISGLIEARSCERFRLLAVEAPDPRLRRFYDVLARSEAGHHHAFTRLASNVADGQEVGARQAALRAAESQIIVSQPPGSRLHSWIG